MSGVNVPLSRAVIGLQGVSLPTAGLGLVSSGRHCHHLTIIVSFTTIFLILTHIIALVIIFVHSTVVLVVYPPAGTDIEIAITIAFTITIVVNITVSVIRIVVVDNKNAQVRYHCVPFY